MICPGRLEARVQVVDPAFRDRVFRLFLCRSPIDLSNSETTSKRVSHRLARLRPACFMSRGRTPAVYVCGECHIL